MPYGSGVTTGSIRIMLDGEDGNNDWMKIRLGLKHSFIYYEGVNDHWVRDHQSTTSLNVLEILYTLSYNNNFFEMVYPPFLHQYCILVFNIL